MKIFPYDPDASINKRPEIFIGIRVNDGGDGVIVYACDKSGCKLDFGNLVEFSPRGLYRFHGVNKDFEFPQNSNGQVERYKE